MGSAKLVARIAAGVVGGVILTLVLFILLGLILAGYVFGEHGAGEFQKYVMPLLMLSFTCGARFGVCLYRIG